MKSNNAMKGGGDALDFERWVCDVVRFYAIKRLAQCKVAVQDVLWAVGNMPPTITKAKANHDGTISA